MRNRKANALIDFIIFCLVSGKAVTMQFLMKKEANSISKGANGVVAADVSRIETVAKTREISED